jgi:hypothetical protein
VYPDLLSITNESMVSYLPRSLVKFLQLLLGNNAATKVAAIGQSVVQGVRPKVIIAPMQLALAVQLHHHFGSRFLTDLLHSFGFCSSYSEVQKFEKNAAVAQGTEVAADKSCFVQHIADNIDHNVCTLNGRDTFHGMGIVATFIPEKIMHQCIPRLEVTGKNLIEAGRLRKLLYVSNTTGASMPICFQDLPSQTAIDLTAKLHIVWKSSFLCQYDRPSRPGLMQLLHQGQHPGKSEVVLLPMIDENPNDLSCIYSTLNFICDQALYYNCTPILTFDQLLWWKAMKVINNEPQVAGSNR